MKKFVSLVLALLMILSTFSFASAEDKLELNAMCVLYQQAPAEDSPFWTWMEDTFNVDYTVEWVPNSGYDDKLSLVLSTGDLPDLIQVNSTTSAAVVNAANDGMFYDLTDLLDWEKYPNLAKLNPSAWTSSKINGRNYFLPRTRGQYNSTIFMRKDILEAAGMSVPHTISEFQAYFQYIKDNYPDMVPLAYTFSYVETAFLGAFGDGQIIPVFTEDGTGIVHQNLTESYALMLGWMQELYAKGLYASEFALYNTDKNNDMFLSGKTGMRVTNLWHRWRFADTVAAAVEGADVVPSFYTSSDDGEHIAPYYDIGFNGGHALNADLPEEKVIKILEFLDKTAATDMYNTFRYGLEGVHWNMVDGFPVATEQGLNEVTNSLYGPFTLATNLYDKVDSPLATNAYNLESRELAVEVDQAAQMVGACPWKLFTILKSNAWSEFWAVYQSEFESYVAETIMGRHTIDEFRSYQAELAKKEEVQLAFKEFKANYDDFNLASWTAPVMD